MSSRPSKRERKKQAAAERKLAMLRSEKRRRRQRTILLASVTALLVVGVGAVAFTVLTRETPEEPVAPTPSPAPVACGSTVPEAAGEEKPTFPEPQDQGLTATGTHVLRLETSCGTIDVQLAVDSAPETANSVAFLAAQGFYDGLTFHRLVPDFVIQGGDPLGDGTGGSGYQVTEPPPSELQYTRGMVAMAKSPADPPGTSGSQFFIVQGDEAVHLPAEYALVGHVVAGMDVVDRIIEDVPIDGQTPLEAVYIDRATMLAEP